MLAEQEHNANQLNMMRDKFAASNASSKKALYDKIINIEKSYEQQCDDISKLEKEIRNSENMK